MYIYSFNISINEEELLYNAYYNSLKLAIDNDCKSIGFQLISAGIFGYPIKQAFEVAIKACIDFINNNKDIEIILAILDKDIIKIGKDVLEKYN